MIRSFFPYRRAFTSSTRVQNVLRRTITQSTRHGARLKIRKPSTPSDPTTVTKPESIVTGKWEYPEGLRIYSRSGMRLALLGCIRLIPFVLVGLWTVQVGVSVINDSTPISWPHLLQASAALVPIMVVVPMTSGYVAWILVRLPQEARRNRTALMNWAKNMPADTMLEIKTVRANGFGRATDQCALRDLRPFKPTLFRQANFQRLVDPEQDKRRVGTLWSKAYAWMSEPPRFLKIREEEGLKTKMVKEKSLWPEIVKKINARAASQNQP